LIENLEFTEGAIELDLKGSSERRHSFLGIAFNVADGKTFEAVYFRPFNFKIDDKEARGHAVQYVSWPDQTWEKLRTGHPGVYESTVNPVPDPDGWFHARIQVTTRR